MAKKPKDFKGKFESATFPFQKPNDNCEDYRFLSRNLQWSNSIGAPINLKLELTLNNRRFGNYLFVLKPNKIQINEKALGVAILEFAKQIVWRVAIRKARSFDLPPNSPTNPTH